MTMSQAKKCDVHVHVYISHVHVLQSMCMIYMYMTIVQYIDTSRQRQVSGGPC